MLLVSTWSLWGALFVGKVNSAVSTVLPRSGACKLWKIVRLWVDLRKNFSSLFQIQFLKSLLIICFHLSVATTNSEQAVFLISALGNKTKQASWKAVCTVESPRACSVPGLQPFSRVACPASASPFSLEREESRMPVQTVRQSLQSPWHVGPTVSVNSFLRLSSVCTKHLRVEQTRNPKSPDL